MKPNEAQRPFIDGFSPKCSRVIFTEREWLDLKHAGRLFEALVRGEIEPANETQEEFVKCFNPICDDPPAGYCANLWWRYLGRAALEKDPDFKRDAGGWTIDLPPMRGWSVDRSYPEGGTDVFFSQRRRR